MKASKDKACWGCEKDFSDVLCFHRNRVSVSIETLLCVSHRDAVAKILYSLLFNWLTERVNGRVYPHNEALSISILDIYGFEVKPKTDLTRSWCLWVVFPCSRVQTCPPPFFPFRSYKWTVLSNSASTTPMKHCSSSLIRSSSRRSRSVKWQIHFFILLRDSYFLRLDSEISQHFVIRL